MNQNYKTYLQNSRKNKITEHFTVFEVANSLASLKLNIDNRPTAQVISNAKLFCVNILEKVRINFNQPVNIHSFYRSPELNYAIGGVKPDIKKGIRGSQHIYGEAADITVQGYSVQEVFDYIKNNLIYDQVIQEGTWVHVSFSPVGKNRKQALKLINGKYIAV